MKQNQFIHSKSENWKRFEAHCNQADNLPSNFPTQFRQICSDLSIAKTRNYSPTLVQNLNRLVQLGQTHLYKGSSLSLRQILHVFTRDFPTALYTTRYYMWGSFFAFYGFGLLAFIWVLISPDAIYHFLDPQSVNNLESMYNPSGSTQSLIRGADSDVLMLGVYIFNNIGIAFQMIGGGALFGIGALIPLLFNSFYLGAVFAHMLNVGYTSTFYSFVISHGSFELMAIVVAGAAGSKIGFSLLAPGNYTRAYAFKAAGKQVMPLIVGAFVMLFIAAFIEAFWSPRDIPSAYKYFIGSIGWLFVCYRLYKGVRYGT